MLWTTLLLGTLITLNGIAAGSRLWLIAQDRTRGDSSARPRHTNVGYSRSVLGINSSMSLLHIAKIALGRGAYLDVRYYAEQAIVCLRQSGASPAHLAYADQVLHDALWPGLRPGAAFARSSAEHSSVNYSFAPTLVDKVVSNATQATS